MIFGAAVRGAFGFAIYGAAAVIGLAQRTVQNKVPVATGNNGYEDFRNWLGTLNSGTFLELGTRRTANGLPTGRREWAPHLRYIGSDFQAGYDVDIVADAERLSDAFEKGSIDAVIACSVFEHIRRPWLAAEEIGKVLRPGGRIYIQTHNCFPIHAYPFDYWRFTREAMEVLFCRENGFCQQQSWYDFPAAIVSAREPFAATCQAFLNVNLTAAKA